MLNLRTDKVDSHPQSNCHTLKVFSKLFGSGRIQWLEEQLRCERAFNEDLKARLHDVETEKDGKAASPCKPCDCSRQAEEKSREMLVRSSLQCRCCSFYFIYLFIYLLVYLFIDLFTTINCFKCRLNTCYLLFSVHLFRFFADPLMRIS